MAETDGAPTPVCSVDDVAEDSPVVTTVDGIEIAVILTDGEYHALQNVCPHQGGPVGEGKVDDGSVYCPWHGWQFDLESGDHVHKKGEVTTYPVRVEDGQIVVEV